MAQLSKEKWEEILDNQKFPLVGTNEPNNGNGYHDEMSWKIPFRPREDINDDFYLNSFHTIYLRNLTNYTNPSLSKKKLFQNQLNIINCSKNYFNTTLKYFSRGNFYLKGDLLDTLGKWGENLCHNGRVIIEIIGWFDNKTSQFYGYNLRYLDTRYCKVSRNNIIYQAPFKLEGEKEVFKKVKIPKSKCLIIDFPKEKGGYKGFLRKVRKVKKLGNKFNYCRDPNIGLSQMKNWDIQFNKAILDWGASNKIDDVTEFYQILSALRFKHLTSLCTLQLIDGLSQLINYLNIKLKEDAKLEFNINQYQTNYFPEIINKWMNEELSFKEANEILRN